MCKEIVDRFEVLRVVEPDVVEEEIEVRRHDFFVFGLRILLAQFRCVFVKIREKSQDDLRVELEKRSINKTKIENYCTHPKGCKCPRDASDTADNLFANFLQVRTLDV